jgi:transposase
METHMPETLFPLPEPEPLTERPARGKPRLWRANRQQVEMRLASLDALLPADHRARLVWALVQDYDLSAFYAQIEAVEGAPGHPAIDPALLLAVWLYATLEGVGSARALERLCAEHLAYQWLLGGVSVNYHTLADFRVTREAALDAVLTHSVAALMREGLVDLTQTAQDGVRLRASAGASSFRRAETLAECLTQAEQHVQQLKQTPEHAADPTGPAPTARQAAARERAARERLARVKQALQAVEQLDAAKAKRREKKRRARVVRASTTDPDARVTKMADGGFRPAYNGQVSVDMGSRIIVGVDVGNTADPQQLEPMLEQTQTRYAQVPAEHYVDGGFRTNAGITAARVRGVTLYTPLPRARADRAQPPHTLWPSDSPAVREWKQRMQTDAAKAKYKARAATVEWANALLRNRGLQRVLVRGLTKVRAVLLWFALAHNLLQTVSLRRGRGAAAG